MQRREFLAAAGLGGAGLCLGTPLGEHSSPSSILDELVAQNDAVLDGQLARQQLDAARREVGGLPDEHGLYHAGAAAGLLRDGAVAFVSETSRRFRSEPLLERLLLAARFLRRVQHADGTIDLLTTNFHSPPDTGFCLEWICAATGLLRAAVRVPEALLSELEGFVRRAADALAVGGVHTPNHRWVICMALARAHRLFPDARYVARIDAWLGEGIDIDADGQFTERSAAIYSPLTDRCLLTVARTLDRPELFEPVRRNLEMTLHYLHAGGEIATEGSRRQDQDRRSSYASYHVPYRHLALVDRNGRFAAAARWLEEHAREELTGNAVFFAEDSAFRAELPPSEPLPTSFEKHFAGSDLVRIRRGKTSATILAGQPIFLSLHHGGAAVALRCASAFFGKGQLLGGELRKDGADWVLTQELEGPYWQPLPPERRSGADDWAKTVRETRTPSEVQHLRSTVRVREVPLTQGAAFEVEIAIEGTEHVPVALELGFRRGGTLAGERLLPIAGSAGSFLLSSGRGRYALGEDAIEFGPGRAEHSWTAIRGALPQLDLDCVFLTGTTPFLQKLRFDCGA